MRLLALRQGRYAAALLTALPLLAAGCLHAQSPTPAAFVPGSSTASASATPPVAPATLVSQPQPGASGVLMSGVVTLNGQAPPDGSTLYLALVKSADDVQPRTCIDAERNPVNNVGQFYAQVACKPQQGDMLLYVLIIGRPEDRNWHRGVIPMPLDLTNFRVDTQ